MLALAGSSFYKSWQHVFFLNADYIAVLDIKENKLTVNNRVLVM
jgi:hypothetical protein